MRYSSKNASFALSAATGMTADGSPTGGGANGMPLNVEMEAYLSRDVFYPAFYPAAYPFPRAG